MRAAQTPWTHAATFRKRLLSRSNSKAVTRQLAERIQVGELNTYYRVLTDPSGGLKPQIMLDWVMSRAGDRAGPFASKHLREIGVTLRALGSGFPRGAPPDKIIYKYNARLPLRDVEAGDNFWIISELARQIIEAFAAKTTDIVPAKVFVRRDGSDEAAAARWLCDVIDFEDCIDEQASEINWVVNAPRYDAVGSKFVFKPIEPQIHLFRLLKAPEIVVCSAEMQAALHAAGLTGLVFRQF